MFISILENRSFIDTVPLNQDFTFFPHFQNLEILDFDQEYNDREISFEKTLTKILNQCRPDRKVMKKMGIGHRKIQKTLFLQYQQTFLVDKDPSF